jgi:hypothetical protein
MPARKEEVKYAREEGIAFSRRAVPPWDPLETLVARARATGCECRSSDLRSRLRLLEGLLRTDQRDSTGDAWHPRL